MGSGHDMDSDIAGYLMEINSRLGSITSDVANIKENMDASFPKFDKRLTDLENVKYKMLGVAGMSGGGVAGAWEFIQGLFKHLK